MNDNLSFTDLFDLADIQKLQDAFAAACNIASIITAPDGTPYTKPSNFCRLCIEIIRQNPRGLSNCMKSDSLIGKAATQNFQSAIVQPCMSGGLWDGGASISVNGKHIATWLVGQVRNETQNDDQLLKYADDIGADKEAFRQALAEVPKMSKQQFDDICQALFLFSNLLSKQAFQQLQLQHCYQLKGEELIQARQELLQSETMASFLEQKVSERTRELYQKNEVLVHLNHEIADINKRLLDSIEYAKVIQSALLPDFQQVQTFLPHSFVIWQPRDIVGGDMLYVEAFGDEFLVVVMDCTGHGVPGALMTMVAATNLRRIVRDGECHQPAAILQHLNVLMKASLQQDTDQARSDDGLDAAICLVQPQARQLLFAGAKLPLYYRHHHQVKMIKGDKQNLGYKRSDVHFTFTTHTLPLEPEMVFYLATDGLIDQLGGPKRLPLGSKRFQALLLECRQDSVADQAPHLLRAFQAYQGENERLDDVTVVGFGV